MFLWNTQKNFKRLVHLDVIIGSLFDGQCLREMPFMNMNMLSSLGEKFLWIKRKGTEISTGFYSSVGDRWARPRLY